MANPKRTAAAASRDPRIDAYIAKCAAFAKPILEHLRTQVHAGCPQVEETIKWGSPHFMHRGMLCGMAAFKAHCAFGFWKGKLVFDDAKSRDAMGQFGCITSLKDLPADRALRTYVKKAAKLNESGAKVPRPLKHPKKDRSALDVVPADLATALRRNSRARKTFEGFSPSRRREYIEWITEAKREETRVKRLATTMEWLEEGKAFHWRYQ